MSGSNDSSNLYLKLLQEFALALLQRSTLDDIFWLIANKAIADLGFDDCVIYLKRESDNILTQEAAFGPKNPSGRLIKDPITIPVGEGIVGSVALHKRSERIADTRLDKRYILDDAFRLSELAVPILIDDECIGVIDSEHAEADFYTERHEEILTTIASMAAVKISDAIRTEKLRATVTKLEYAQETLAQQTVELIEVRDAAQGANRAKSEFLATMSHEIRTPLNAIVGTASLMKDMELGAESREPIDIIRASSKHLLSLVTDVLDFSRIEANELELVESDVALAPLLESVVSVCRSASGPDSAAIELTVDPTLPDRIKTDELRLRQVLVNLLGNALKFTERGRVQLTAQRVVAPAAQDLLQIGVKDTGIGISPEDLETIFTPFHQADASYSREFGGAGLGLCIAQNLTRLMGGEIAASSSPGQGSEFVVTLPLESIQAPPRSSVQVAPRPSEGGMRVLVAEDNPMNQRVILRMLQRGDYLTDLAANGAEAVEAMERQPYDIVLMDLQMPVMDGFEAIERIRKLDAISQPTIIVISGNAQPTDRDRSMSVGGDAFLAKPVELKTLLDLLDNLPNRSTSQVHGL